MTGYSERAVADAIAAFLADHPECADTVEGIEQWWLRPQGVTPSRELIERALALLEKERVIVSRCYGERTVWRAVFP
ncbi:hypothetical protein [Dyella nitratireducens]|uniref:Uncharacterized protein n=1 Tax=Dyella nitratireducens TaxID=1849580 RepID=A0ABQ1FNG5_9GAMM|nr:hypothetical protein [Dyella nitratireducens]GGA20898.1 hypothetical protein GCM10010981_06240 [Dyella nitratireducens]GLQ44314.1 hypothetical protein GCM10007902_41640 [Dyella nitratireducens]